MRRRLILWALIAAVAAPAAAQQWPDQPGGAPPAQSKAKPKAKAKQPPPDDVEELTPAQIQRAQELDRAGGKDMPQAVKRPSKGGGQPRQIDCRGAFARDFEPYPARPDLRTRQRRLYGGRRSR